MKTESDIKREIKKLEEQMRGFRTDEDYYYRILRIRKKQLEWVLED